MRESVLFSNITVVSESGSGQPLVMSPAWVAVRDGHVVSCSSQEAQARMALEGTAYTTYEGSNCLLVPAWVNSHNHMAMTLLRNKADDMSLHTWLFDAIFPREARLTREMVLRGNRLALAEMIRSGCGLSADMYYFEDAAAEAALEAGFRLNLCIDVKRRDSTGRTWLDEAHLSEQIRQLDRHPSGLLRVSLLIHSVYLYESGLYPLMASLAQSARCPVQVHVAETQREVDDCLDRYGRRPAAQLEAFGLFRTPTVAAHCVYLDDDERDVLRRNHVHIAHCPASNLKLASGIADVKTMLDCGLSVGIGTDGPASNNNLDLYRDMRLASYLAKAMHKDAAVLPAGQILSMVTAGAASALGFAQSGRIEEGAAADLQVVRTDSAGMTPLGNPVSALVYSASASDVESLMVDGRWLMLRRELKTLDEEKILYEAREASTWLEG